MERLYSKFRNIEYSRFANLEYSIFRNLEYSRSMSQLKPQDVLVALECCVLPDEPEWTYGGVARSIGLSASEVHAAVTRAIRARLLAQSEPRPALGAVRPIRANIFEFLVHGAKYAFPAERGEMTRGVPTAHAAPVLRERFAPSKEPPPVWPSPDGTVRGMAFAPLHKAAVKAAAGDAALYALLALVDAIRGGGAREREVAEKLLRAKLLGARE
jgi:hypothetical protein